MTRRAIGRGVVDALSGLPLFATAPLFRHWHLSWGATEEEVRGSMPGDDIVPKASFRGDRPLDLRRRNDPQLWSRRLVLRERPWEEGEFFRSEITDYHLVTGTSR